MKRFFLFIVAALSLTGAIAQVTGQPRQKMAIFTSLYLDDAFGSDGSYRYTDKTFPKASIPGLEFYHGAQMAIDSLDNMGLSLDIYVYDSKSRKETLDQQFSKCAADGVSLIIANCQNTEVAKLAGLAASKKIMLINATVPNDGNAVDNPYFVVLNPTLKTQVEGVYDYIKKNYAGRKLVVLNKKGVSEDYIKAAFEGTNKANNNAVSVRFVNVADTVFSKLIADVLDKTQPSLFLIGSLDAAFAGKVLAQLSLLTKEQPTITAVGMPTLENVDLSTSKFKGVEIIYSTPFYNPRTDAVSRNLQAYYNRRMYARPSDLVFRGYGLTYTFGRLLSTYGKGLSTNMNAKGYSVFYDYDFQPVYSGGKVGYIENKKLYFLKYLDGSLLSVN
ncbi:MAG: ABC transporter substrate-binding protein [Niabella sp.]